MKHTYYTLPKVPGRPVDQREGVSFGISLKRPTVG